MAPSEEIVSSIMNFNQEYLLKALAGSKLVLMKGSKKVVSIGKDSENGVIDLIQNMVSNENVAKDPFFVLDVGVVVSHWKRWKDNLPNFRPYYAVKCNPDRYLLGALAALGAGFDCASRAEIEAVLALGVPAHDIIYANPCKAEDYVKYAAEVEVNLTTFDSIDEVYKLKAHHPNTAAIIRIHPPVDSGAKCPLGPKFGALPEEVRPLLEAARDSGLKVDGVSFHIGSGTTRADAYRGALWAARGVFDLAEQLGMPPMTILNVGGGFTSDCFENAAAAIRKAMQDFFPSYENALALMAEPGRYFAETPFTLAANIIGKRVRGRVREYWINDGIYGSLNCIILDHAVVNAIPVACKSNKNNPRCEGEKTHKSTVFGPTCDALDTILKGYELPELEINDWLVFRKMGAYTSAAGTSFNGFATSSIRTELAYSSTF